MIRLTIEIQPGRRKEELLLEELVDKRILEHVWGLVVWMCDLNPKLKAELKAEIVEES